MHADDIWSLRRQGCEQGFNSKATRGTSWPAVLGSYVPAHSRLPRPAPSTQDRQIMLDVSRAMHFDTCVSWSAATRDRHLASLAAVLHAAFVPEDAAPVVSGSTIAQPLYYQGCHDVASVLLLELGQDAASDAMRILLQSHFAGIAQGNMDIAMILVDVVTILLRAQDDALVACLRAADVWDHMHVTLAWIITWFAHNVTHVGTAARLFDLFIATHPMMPVYVSAALMLEHSSTIRALQPHSFEVVYPFLQRLPSMLRAGGCSVVINRALKLYAALPPRDAVKRLTAKQRSMLQQRWPAVLRFPDDHGDVVLLTPPRRPSLCARAMAIQKPSSLLARHVIAVAVAGVAFVVAAALMRAHEYRLEIATA